MIGLIRKDMYCLRKNLKLLLGVTAGVIVIALLYILSSKYGNIARGYEVMAEESFLKKEDLLGMTKVVVYFSLLVPIAFLGTIVECFKEDWKAGFYKCMMSMPLNDAKRVGSRYVSCLLFALVGMAGSMLAAFLISLVSEDMPFINSLRYIVIFETVLLVYMSFIMFLLYWLGAGKADLIQCIPFVLVLIVVEVLMGKELASVPEGEEMQIISGLAESISSFVNHYGYLLFPGALLCMGISFLGSWIMIKRRKGNV